MQGSSLLRYKGIRLPRTLVNSYVG